ncbi:MAG: class I SAM-dependent methyltransferase [Tannerella sp.]|nr:class I SAM-dependent methyltransferase [Tannerella sp.]
MNRIEPDNTAVRTALWRALHVQADAKPSIIEDEVGLQLIAPPDGWKERPDMKFTKRIRASIIARTRFIEDLIMEKSRQGIEQYVILGAGLDTFAQRHPDMASKLQIYEIDRAGTLVWKRRRLVELGFGIPGNLHLTPVDFEHESWFQQLLRAGFDAEKPAVVVCTGVTLYLTKEAIVSTLQQLAEFASGSTFAVTFNLPVELINDEDKPLIEMSIKGARESGTPMISFLSPEEILTLARNAKLKNAGIISTRDMEQRYFAGRTDHLLPAEGEVFLLAAI